MELLAKQPLVLIVDDEANTRMVASEYLSQNGFTVVEAEDGHSALETISKFNPDLILLDVEMPGISGFEVCKTLRASKEHALTPVLLLTGLKDDDAIKQAYEAGATDFAIKPINWSLLPHRLSYMHRTSLAAIELLQEQDILASAQRIAKLGSWQLDTATGVTKWSDELYKILGLVPGECEPSYEQILKYVCSDEVGMVSKWLVNTESAAESSPIEYKIILPNGSVRNVRQQVEKKLDADGNVTLIQAIVQDFTAQRLVENKVRQLAYFDTLTELPNRALFHDRLEVAMSDAEAKNQNVAVYFIDLDDFKRVNDTFGHALGDQLLQEVGRRLRSTLRKDPENSSNVYQPNTVARMGGDEFTIIIRNLEKPEHAELIAQRIIDVMAEPIHLDGLEIHSSPSIGIAIYPRDGEDTETLIKNADLAMYEAKGMGKNSYRVHNAEMDDKAKRHFVIDRQMRLALENEEFTLNYQPQMLLSNGNLYSAEALLRWNNESLGFVSPAEFIPVSEDNGLIVPIGEWVLRTACKQAKQWIDTQFEIQSVAVNVSALQFQRDDFVDVVIKTLEETGLPATNLELEITESLLASDISHAVKTLKLLNELGVHLSIDDFGTGYSSLSQLKNFPIDRLKIDQSFIRNVTENDNDAAITRAVIAMASSMGIKVLAEGVETEEHLQFLRENNCDEIQGYFISKPSSADDLQKQMPGLLEVLDKLYNSDSNLPKLKAV